MVEKVHIPQESQKNTLCQRQPYHDQRYLLYRQRFSWNFYFFKPKTLQLFNCALVTLIKSLKTIKSLSYVYLFIWVLILITLLKITLFFYTIKHLSMHSPYTLENHMTFKYIETSRIYSISAKHERDKSQEVV